MERFPVFFNLTNQHCLVVGGGTVATRKINKLVQAGALVSVVAPYISQELQLLFAEYPKQLMHFARAFLAEDLAKKHLVIAATNDSTINAEVATLAKQRYLPVNVVDAPELGTFILPSIVDRSPITVAISTGGASPVLARQLRTRLETLLPANCGDLAALTESYREQVKQQLPESQRKAFWEKLLNSAFVDLVYAGHTERAKTFLEDLLAQFPGDLPLGEVYLVGAGSGDPDLLTIKALRLMQQADVVVYDRLVSKPILEMVNAQAERLYVGKEKANHAVPQGKINDLLVQLAMQGKRVLRLKGGDPFIFGRGGEEIETLAENGIPFQVVPGITAAAGCSAYAGIPLTHRDYAQSCTFATGHLKDGTIDLNWTQLAQPNQTVVFYMGLTGIEIISEQLQAHGRAGDTPAALIEQGTTPNQRVHIGTLANLPQLVRDSGARAPTLTIIGEVVELQQKLHWFEPSEHSMVSAFSRHAKQAAAE